MQTVTTREFYHNAKLVDGLPPGGKLLVTSRGRPKFIVRRTDERPRMTEELLRKSAVSSGNNRKIDLVAVLQDLKD